MVLLLALACLTNEDLYGQRRALLTDQDGDGITEEQGDCDDTDPDVFPGHAEDCNDGKNNDCSTTETVCVWPASIDMTDRVVINR
jgi:hypothetical protein